MPLRSIESYGGIKVNLLDPEVPESEESAEEGNRKAVDLAMFSGTSLFASVMFTPTSTAAPTTVSPASVTIRSHAGNGSPAKPVITKTATGLYTITFASTWTDDMEPPVTEDLAIAMARASYSGSTLGFARVTTWTDYVVNVALVSSLLAASDLSGAGSIIVDINV